MGLLDQSPVQKSLRPSRSLQELWSQIIGGSAPVHFIIAFFVGVVAGLGAVLFRKLIAFFHNLFFFGHFSFAYDTLQFTATSPWGIWILLAPAIGSLGVAWMVQNFAPEARGHGVPEVMDAIYYQRGFMRPQVVIVKAIASALNIGSGGSVGREGPIIQMGAAFAANLSRWLRLEEWQRYALIAAGAGGGIAATFNTPIGGVLFAIELMMPEISARTLIPVMITTGTATYISRFFLGNHPSFIIPALHIAGTAHTSPEMFAAYLLLGIAIGLCAWLFMRSIYWFEDMFDALPGNYYSRHFSGMVVVGAIIFLVDYFYGHYYVEGVGYATVQAVLNTQLVFPGLLVLLALLKLLVTSLTLGSGGSGGTFSPSLFIGATLGGTFAIIGHYLDPTLDLNVMTAAALGMAGMVGAGTGAAMTGAVMIFEMTGDHNIVIPLIIVVSVAYAIRRLITPDTIYTIKLKRRKHYVPESRQSNLYLSLPVSSFIDTPFIRLDIQSRWSPNRLQRLHLGKMPHILVESSQHIMGVIPASTLAEHPSELPLDLKKHLQTEWIIVSEQAEIVDLLIKIRYSKANIFIISKGESPSPEDVSAILAWNDVAPGVGLAGRLRGEENV